MAQDKSNTGKTVKLRVNAPDAPIEPPVADAPTARISTEGPISVQGADMVKKPEFLDQALAGSDIKKSDAKPAIDAALATLAKLLKEGQEVQLPPLGKLRVVKAKEVGEGAQVLTLKLRTMKDSV